MRERARVARLVGMRVLMAVVIALATGCAVDEDPSSTELSADACPYRPEPTFCSPVGASCDSRATRFCGNGLAWCTTSNVCRPFCSAVEYPPCAPGQVPHRETVAAGTVCSCSPE